MADIAMCAGKGCQLKNECYRYTATVNEHWQSYYNGSPFKDGECDMFWDNSEYKKTKS